MNHIFVARGHVFAYASPATTPPTPLHDAHQGGYFFRTLLGVALTVEKPPALEHLDAFQILVVVDICALRGC